MDISTLMFNAKDRQGGEHQYIVSPHIGSQGLKVIDAMLAIGMGPMAEAAFSAARASEAQKKAQQAVGKEAEKIEISLSQILDNIDLNHIVTSAQTGIKSAGGMEILAPLVLQYTTRDGQPLIGKGANRAIFDIAYTQNWGELRVAFMKVMEINGFFELLAGWFEEEETPA